MPIHEFIHEETGEALDIYVPASAPSIEHQRQTKDGKVYKRVYSVPLAAQNMGTRLGSATPEDFARVTADSKRGLKIGDMWEVSAEMAAKRKDRDGVDMVREEGYKRYEKENGERHPDVIRREKVEKANARLAEMGIKVNL